MKKLETDIMNGLILLLDQLYVYIYMYVYI